MPKYQFQCCEPSCAAIFELTRPMVACSDPAECPDCGMVSKRLYSLPMVSTWQCSDTWAENKACLNQTVEERKADDKKYEASYGAGA